MAAPGKRVAGILAGALVLRLAVAWAPGEWLLRRVLADDPFYYFTIARHFAHGSGLTFDGVAPTNGVHPLWLFAITPIFGALGALGSLSLVRDGWLAIHLTLTLAAVLDVVALWLLCRLLREINISGPVLAAVALLYAASPILLSLAGPLNGLETALNLALSFAFLSLYRRELAEPTGGFGAATKLGVTSGLLFLARTDNVVLLAFSLSYLAWRARDDRARLRRLVVAALVAVAVAAPWLVWSYGRFGSPIQVSGLAAARFTRALVADGWTAADYALKFARNLATLAAYFPVFHLSSNSLAKAGAANAALIALLVAAAVRGQSAGIPPHGQALRRRLGPWVPPLLAGGLFVLVHTLRAIELRAWYYTSLLPIAYVVLALVADDLVAAARRAPRPLQTPAVVGALGGGALVVALVVAPVGALVLSWHAALADRCGEIDGYRMIQSVNASVPDGTLLGSWNAGLFGYFYQRGEVVNLDGLVNNDAYRHHLDGSLADYVSERKIDFLLDAAGAIDLWKPHWNRGAPVSFRPPLLDDTGQAECRRMVLVPLAP